MGYYVSTMIGIRTGGVFSQGVDTDDMKQRIKRIANQVDSFNADLDKCMSPEMVATKGAYVVVAGVFNHWGYSQSSEFARRLSVEFGVEVMIMAWDEQTGDIQSNVFLDGKPLVEVPENPITRIVRRVG